MPDPCLSSSGPIGVFDSGFGGLCILGALTTRLPHQRFIYLGDHMHAPYGTRSRQELFDLTTRNVAWLFDLHCDLVILACNTASAVLRPIQHRWLQPRYPDKRILGIIVPTIEMITGVHWNFSTPPDTQASSVTVGVFATEATVDSGVYQHEIHKRAPNIVVIQQRCPSLTGLIEDGAALDILAQEVQTYVTAMKRQMKGSLPDYILLGCTHYILIADLFRAALGPEICLIDQPDCVADSLVHYLEKHPHFASKSMAATPELFTTGDAEKVNRNGARFLKKNAKFTAVRF